MKALLEELRDHLVAEDIVQKAKTNPKETAYASPLPACFAGLDDGPLPPAPADHGHPVTVNLSQPPGFALPAEAPFLDWPTVDVYIRASKEGGGLKKCLAVATEIRRALKPGLAGGLMLDQLEIQHVEVYRPAGEVTSVQGAAAVIGFRFELFDADYGV